MSSQADSPPAWPQPPIPAHLLHRRRPRSSSLLATPAIVLLVSIPALIVLSCFAIPRVFSVSNQLGKSAAGVRRGWDTLNVVLVLFAILCGIFAPRRDDEAVVEGAGRAGIGRLRRNGGSYPDLMQESWPATGEGQGRFRSFDDFAVAGYYQRLDRPARVPLRRWQSAIDESDIKENPVDTFVRGSRSPPSEASQEQVKPRPPPNPPPPPAPPTARQKKRQTYAYKAVGETATPPQPPLPPLQREQSPVRIERRKSSATAEIKVIIASVLSANKRKKRRPKAGTIEEYASARHSMDKTPDRKIPPPRPPPPPPQPQSFLSIFRNTSKTRRIHSASAQSPQPPPTPAEQGRRSTASRSTKPPIPKLPKNNREDRSTRPPPGIPATTPPPLHSRFSPNRRQRSRKSGIAEADGDVSGRGRKRVESSSDGDGDKEAGHVDGEDVVSGGPGTGAAFCESPDVNAKADTFIARLKDGWRLERINSIREKHGLSVGPGPL